MDALLVYTVPLYTNAPQCLTTEMQFANTSKCSPIYDAKCIVNKVSFSANIGYGFRVFNSLSSKGDSRGVSSQAGLPL